VATVSDTPWGNFSQADYSPEQWKKACLVDTGQGDEGSKGRYKLPVREPGGALNRNGVHAAAGGHGIGAVDGITEDERRKVAKELVSMYTGDLKEEPPPSLEKLAGVESAAEDAAEGRRAREVWERVYPLDGIKVLTRAQGYGDGRTVEAYAAVFDQPQEIIDEHGHYRERIARSAFNKTISDGALRRAMCLYHHGFNVVDTKPNPLGQVPLGRPLEIKADGKGLLTVTRYNKSELADAVLEAIRNEDIRGQSFRGAIYGSDPRKIPRTRRGEALPLVTRTELGLRDYGPTPTPYYDGAEIVAVRARDLFSRIESLSDEERAELFRMMLAATRETEPEPFTSTAESAAGPEEPVIDDHSRRARVLKLRAQAAMAFGGR
jgi:HK97 family phage prohead protease